MPPFKFQGDFGATTDEVAPTPRKLDMSSGYNDVGGRPDERLGLSGSFTPGVRIVAGGPFRDVPLEAEFDHGTVLFTYPELKPDMSGEARTNAVRPNERLGGSSCFTPGARRWLGGLPRDVSLEKEIDRGTVLFTYPELKPDMSGEARTNAVRPTERWGGSSGSFTPGAKRWLGGLPRDVSLEKEIDHGTVLFTYPDLKPDMSREARTNAARPDERLGTSGRFTADIRCFLGGEPRDVPLEVETIDHGTVLSTFPELKPDTSGEARTNPVRPDERLGTTGSFTPGGRHHWLGGEPRDIAREPEVMHGTVLFSSGQFHSALGGGGGGAADGDDGDSGDFFLADGIDEDDDEEEVGGGPMQVSAVPSVDAAMFNGFQQKEMAAGGGAGSDGVFRRCGSDSKIPQAGGDGVFRRCGSDSKFPPAGADLMSGTFPAF